MNRQTETLQISAYNLSICSIISYYSAGLDQKHHHTPAKIINRVSLFTKDRTDFSLAATFSAWAKDYHASLYFYL